MADQTLINLNIFEGDDYLDYALINENFENIDSAIQQVTADCNNKVDKVEGKGLSTEDYTTAEKTKLSGIQENANNYTHPASHPATMITEDATHRFASDTEKSTWNNKVDKVSGKGLSTEDYTTAEKTKLAGIQENANNYTHPATHPATMITEDTTHRFATDTEKASWNSKAPGYQYSTTDLTEGSSALATGTLYFVYE